MPDKELFLIDSNILITPQEQYYPFDLAPNFWAQMAEKIEDGSIVIPQRSESSGSITMVPLPSECRESKVRAPAPWGGKGGNASSFQCLPWGIDTFHS